jgi:signal transduction histidine kinase
MKTTPTPRPRRVQSRRPKSAPAAQPAAVVPPAVAPAADPTLMLGMAAHELKNGLGPLGLTLQLAERRALAGQPVEPADLTFARAQVRRLSRLVNDLLDVTHLDTEQFPVRPRRGDLADAVREALDIFARGNARAVAVVALGPVAATFDAERIVQVVLNLLENAAKYSPPSTEIVVGLARAGDVARVEVRDAGPGLSREEQGRVFARFVRANDVPDDTRGLGLGLFICHAIVERHGGRIGVESTPGQGATFWFELPLAPSSGRDPQGPLF